MGIAKVTRNYQVTIPQDVRKLHDIRIGDTVLFAIERERVDFFKIERKRIIQQTAGLWKKSGKENVVELAVLRRGWQEREKRLYGKSC